MMTAAHKTIMCVDDERDVLRTVARTLRADGVEVLAYDDPRRALELLLTDRHVDVIVSDIEMPLMNGLELLGRARDLRPTAARVVLSGVSSIDAAVRAINDGAVHRFVRKPFDPDDLRKVVGEAFEQARAASDAAIVLHGRRALSAWRARMKEDCPQLLEMTLDETGAYVVDADAAEAIAPIVGLEHLVRVWNG